MVDPEPVLRAAPEGLIARVVRWSADHPALVLLVFSALTVWGWMRLHGVPLDAIPDQSDVQVLINAEWKGRSPDLVEDQITYPITSALISAPGVSTVRAESDLGISRITVLFKDGTDLYWARSRILEYLSSVRDRLPAGVNPTLGPDATGVGWIYEYALVDTVGTHDLSDLRALQDFSLKYWLGSVPGVAEVATMGGETRAFKVRLDPAKLEAFRISPMQVVTAVRSANGEVGGRVIEMAGHELIVRSLGYVTRPEDLAKAPITVRKGVAIQVGDVAEVGYGPDMGRGIVDFDGKGLTVGGVVIMRQGENAKIVIDAIKKRINEIRPSLPHGVEIVTTYDRSRLIDKAIDTLRHTLIEEMIVVGLVISVFLLHVRSILVPLIALPIAVLLAFIPMSFQDLTANIMSLGGIAIAIGAMVDASIIIIDNVHRSLEDGESLPKAERRRRMIAAMAEVGPSIFFALLVLSVSFLPVFTLAGAEGRLFKPLAFTKTYAMACSALLAVTLVPAVAILAIRGRIRGEQRNPLTRFLIQGYSPVVRFVVRHPWPVIGLSLIAMAATIPVAMHLQTEYMPPLEEGTVLFMPTSPPGISITTASALIQVIDRDIKRMPEVSSVFGKMGSADTSTDPAPLNMVEAVVQFKPKAQWPHGTTLASIHDEMRRTLSYPGMQTIIWGPIQTRTEMLATGIRSPLAIKVYGADRAAIQKVSDSIVSILTSDRNLARYTAGAYAERIGGGYFLDVVPRRDVASELGVSIADINDIVETAIGGADIDMAIAGRERFPIQVRYARDFREDPQAIGRALVPVPGGAMVPLSEVADIRFTQGPAMVNTENGQLVDQVVVDTQHIGIADYVHLAQAALDGSLKGTPGVHMQWVGQYQHLERADARLKIAIPVTLLLVYLLLQVSTGSLIEAGLVMAAVPFSLIGAVWILWILHYKISVAVWVGIIALAGLDAETGVVMLLYLTLSWRHAEALGKLRTDAEFEEAVVDGAARRIRPKFMTVATLIIGLLPILWSSGAGSDVMRRLAAPMIGGVITSFLLELAVYPAVFTIWKRRRSEARPAPGP